MNYLRKNTVGIIMIGAILALVAVLIFFSQMMRPTFGPTNTLTPTVIPTITVTLSPSPMSGSATVSPSPASGIVREVNIFLIALDDQGKSGEKVGCGDSVVAAKRSIQPTTVPLTASFEELLSIKSRTVGQSGLYNALYQSNLKLNSAKVENGVATIRLSGTLQLGGVCDNPRVEAQLTKTALQFPTVQKAEIFINNLPLKEALSLR